MFSVYLSGWLLPVTPAKMTTKIKGRNQTYDLLDGGEINVIKSAGLTTIEFEALLPNVPYPFAKYEYGFKKADYYLDKLEKLMENKLAFELYVMRMGPDGKLIYGVQPMRVTLEDYEILEDAADLGLDVKVKISLKQYVDYSLKKVSVVTTTAKPTATVRTTAASSRPQPVPAKTYKVKQNDTLWGICKKHLGDGSKYKEVAKLNKIPNPNKLTVGQVIRLA